MVVWENITAIGQTTQPISLKTYFTPCIAKDNIIKAEDVLLMDCLICRYESKQRRI